MSTDETTSAAALVAALTGPRKASGDAGSVEQFSVTELIAADRYVIGKVAAQQRRRGMRFNRLVPSGTVGRRGFELGGGSGNDFGGWGWGGYPE